MNIFISGIGGAGLGPLAEIALDAGYQVFGSDLSHSLQTNELETRGVQIFYSQNAENLAKIHQKNPIDWLIQTSALPPDAPELAFAKTHGIKTSKRDEFLANFIQQKNLKLIAVAGTHGKTTTTAMLVWLFRELKIPVSYSVGATLPFAKTGHFDSNSRYFIYEADEYDRNFLAFYPQISLIPSLDYDHSDIYKTRADYQNAFSEFISQSQKVLLWRQNFDDLYNYSDDNFGNNSRKVLADFREKTRSSSSDFFRGSAKNFREKFTILDEKTSRNLINLAGEKSRQNATLALNLMREIRPKLTRENHNLTEEFDEKLIAKILSEFPGTSRRFEKLTISNCHPELVSGSGEIFTDYAHHPAEIAATVEKAREIAKKSGANVVAIFEPHQNLRQTEIVREGGYGASFAGVSRIFWLPTYLVRGDLAPNAATVLTPENLIKTLDETSRNVAEPAEMNDELFAKIQQSLARGDLVLLMGAGTVDAWIREKIAE